MSSFRNKCSTWWDCATPAKQLAVSLTGCVAVAAGVGIVGVGFLTLLSAGGSSTALATSGAAAASGVGLMAAAGAESRSLRVGVSQGPLDVCAGYTVAGQQSLDGNFIAVAYSGNDNAQDVAKEVAGIIISSDGGTTPIISPASSEAQYISSFAGDDDDGPELICMNQTVSMGTDVSGNGGRAFSVFTGGVDLQTSAEDQGADVSILVSASGEKKVVQGVANKVEPTSTPRPAGEGADKGGSITSMVVGSVAAFFSTTTLVFCRARGEKGKLDAASSVDDLNPYTDMG